MRINIGAEVELNKGEVYFCHYFGDMRYKRNRKNNIEDKRAYGDASKIDRIGIAGELAFGKLLNEYPHCCYDDKPGNPNVDYIINDIEYDVKTTWHLNGRLVVSDYKIKEDWPDFYVLMIGNIPNDVTSTIFHFRGCLDAKTLFDRKTIDLGYGKLSYVAERHEMLNYGILRQEVLARI